MTNDSLPPPKSWIDALHRAEDDVAAGRVVDGAEIHRELLATARRIEEREAADEKQGIHARR
jgi:hypothetical protein